MRWAGTFVSGRRAGTHRYWPVMGGESLLSRDSRARTAARLPPAEAPPTIIPCLGSALRVEALEVAHRRAS